MRTFILAMIIFLWCTPFYAQLDPNGAPITADNVSSNSTAYYEDTQLGFQDCIWGGVRPLNEINTDDSESYPWLSLDGLRLYFTQQQQGQNSFMMASRTSVDSLFGNPDFLSVPQIPDYRPTSCWLTNDELEIFYTVNLSTTTQLYHAVRDSIEAAFLSPTLVEVDGVDLDFYGGPSLTQDKSQLFLYSRIDDVKNLYVFEQTGTHHYTFSHELDVNNPFPGQLTKNGLGYYMTQSNDLYSSYRYTLNGNFGQFDYLQGTINSSSRDIQPTFSENEEIMIFVRNDGQFWESNNLYLVYGDCTPTNVEQVYQSQYGITIQPIPASVKLTINSEIEDIEQVNLYDVMGKHILSRTPKQSNAQIDINIQNLATGVYICQINLKSGHSITRKIVIE